MNIRFLKRDLYYYIVGTYYIEITYNLSTIWEMT